VLSGACDPAIPLRVGYISNTNENMFIALLFIIPQRGKQPQSSEMAEWVSKNMV